MTRLIYALTALAALLITVLISSLITLTILRNDMAANTPRFVSVNMQELVFMLAENAGASEEEFAAAVRNLGRSIEAATAEFGEEHVVVFDSDMILTGAPDVTPQIWQILRNHQAGL